MSPKPKTPLVFGTGTTLGDDALGRPIQPKKPNESQTKTASFTKSIFITRLDAFLSTEKVLKYIKSKGVIVNDANIECRKLVKANQDLNELSFCSFKLSTNDELYSELTSPSFWPPSVGIRGFVANNTNGKRPAATLSPSQSPNGINTAHNSKQSKTDVTVTPNSGRYDRNNKLGIPPKANLADIRNFCSKTD